MNPGPFLILLLLALLIPLQGGWTSIANAQTRTDYEYSALSITTDLSDSLRSAHVSFKITVKNLNTETFKNAGFGLIGATNSSSNITRVFDDLGGLDYAYSAKDDEIHVFFRNMLNKGSQYTFGFEYDNIWSSDKFSWTSSYLTVRIFRSLTLATIGPQNLVFTSFSQNAKIDESGNRQSASLEFSDVVEGRLQVSYQKTRLGVWHYDLAERVDTVDVRNDSVRITRLMIVKDNWWKNMQSMSWKLCSDRGELRVLEVKDGEGPIQWHVTTPNSVRRSSCPIDQASWNNMPDNMEITFRKQLYAGDTYSLEFTVEIDLDRQYDDWVQYGGFASGRSIGYYRISVMAPPEEKVASTDPASAQVSEINGRQVATLSSTDVSWLSLRVTFAPTPIAATATASTQSSRTVQTQGTQGAEFVMPIANLGLIAIGAMFAVIASVLVFVRRRKTAAAAAQQEPALGVQFRKGVASFQPIVATGYPDLDEALKGGVPEGFAVVIVSGSYDERDLLLRRIINASISSGRAVFYISNDLGRTQDLITRYREGFYAFSSQADKGPSHPANLYKIPGIENLSDANISLNIAIKDARAKEEKTRRPLMIIDILADVLLRHKLVTTRRWLSEFVGRQRAEGFTVIACLNPLIGTKDETEGVIDFFDGVFEVYEKPLQERRRRFLVVRKMYGRDYSDNELLLDRQKLL